MKICLVGNFGKSFGQISDDKHLRDALIRLGADVHWIQREEFSSQVLEHEKINVDVTIFFKWNGYDMDSIIRWKRITNAPIVAWTFDAMSIHAHFFPFMKAVDVWLGEELGMAIEWLQKGIEFYYFPNHSAPADIFKKIETPKEYDVVFTGTPYDRGGRIRLLQQLNKHYKVDVFGNNHDQWTNCGLNGHPAKFDEQFSELVGKSKIIIGINAINEIEGMWSIRPAQIMMSGGFLLQKYVPGMERELKDGAAYFHDEDDCIKKVKYYLENPEERQKIADRGYEIAHQNLTSDVRAKELMVFIENYFTFKRDNI